MSLDKIKQQMAFIHEIDKVKYIQRNTRLFNSERKENDAEHSWHLAMMALILSEHANESIDLFKVIKMLLIHDIVEIDAGDIFLFDTKINHNNSDEETKAAQRIFGMLPIAQANELLTIWEEFEEGVTPEAKFARSMDRLEPVLQNLSNNGGTWKEHNVPYEKVINKVSVIEHGSKPIWDFAKNKIDDGVEQGIFHSNT